MKANNTNSNLFGQNVINLSSGSLNLSSLTLAKGSPLLLSSAIAIILPILAYQSAIAATPINTAVDTVSDQQYAWQETLNQQRLETLKSQQVSASQLAATEGEIAEPLQTTQDADNALEGKLEGKPDAKQPTCLPFETIQLEGMDELDASTINTLQKKAQSIQAASCITVNDANQLARLITKAYVDAGYFKVNINSTIADGSTNADGSRNADGSQNADGSKNNVGNSGLNSDRGRVANWHISPAKIVGISNHTKLPTQRLFGDIIGQPANIAWLDQAVSHAERIIDGQLILDVYPVGDDVRIKLTQQGDIDTFSGDMEWYRDPDKSYGHHKIRLHATLRNIFGQADLTSVSIEQGLTDNYAYDDDNQQRSASINTSVPNGRWQWSGLLAGSDSKRTIQLENSSPTQEGNSWQANIRGDFTLARDQDSITTAYGQLAHQEVSSEFLGSTLDNQSPTISSGRVGVTHTKLFTKPSKAIKSATQSTAQKKTLAKNSYLGMSGAWVVDLSADKAFGNHNNPATNAGLSDDYLRWLLTGYLSHNHQFNQAGSVQVTHEVQGQYTDDSMFGISKQSLGSRYVGVRGLENEYNAADKGVTLRNTVSLLPARSSWLTVGQQQWFWSPYFGLDVGWLKDNVADVDRVNTATANGTEQTVATETLDNHSDTAASATAGLKVTSYNLDDASLVSSWDLDISASRPWIDYHYLGNTDDEKGWEDTEVAASLKFYF